MKEWMEREKQFETERKRYWENTQREEEAIRKSQEEQSRTEHLMNAYRHPLDLQAPNEPSSIDESTSMGAVSTEPSD